MDVYQNKIYDFIKLETKSLTLKQECLSIVTDGSINIGDEINIDKILLDYSYIGVMDDEDSDTLPYPNFRKNKGIIRLGKIKLNGKREYETNYIQTSYYDNTSIGMTTPNNVSLYNEFYGKTNKEGKISINKNYIRFFVDNLRILAYGKIDDKRMKARKYYNIHNDKSINPVEITARDTFYYDAEKPEVGLNFTPINLKGEINIKDGLYVKFEPKLSIKDVIMNPVYEGGKFINLSIEYSFEVIIKIYSLVKENLNIYVSGNKINSLS